MERTQKKAANLGQNVQNGWDTRQSVQLFHKETVVRNAVLIYNYYQAAVPLDNLPNSAGLDGPGGRPWNPK